MFIATCNSLASIQPALRPHGDHRSHRIHGGRKSQIAKRHLVPKHLNETGITSKQLEAVKTIETVVEQYTSESGVRGLEKRIGKLGATERKNSPSKRNSVGHHDQLPDVLGPSREKDRYQGNDTPGLLDSPRLRTVETSYSLKHPNQKRQTDPDRKLGRRHEGKRHHRA